MNGFFTLDRDTFENEFFGDEPMSEREAWIWMQANARWKDGRHKVGSEMMDVPRGSFMATLREMQSKFMWRSDTKVRNFLKRLEKEGKIKRTTVGQRNASKTHVSICDYDINQTDKRTENAPETHDERTENAVKKQGNKVTKEQEGLASKAASQKKSPRGSRLSEDWFIPTEWGEWAVSEGWTENTIRAEADKFKDYWLSVAGSKGVKLDWQRTWKNWMRNSKTPKIIVGGRHGTSTHSTTGIASGRSGRDPALEQISRLTGI